MKKMLSVAVAFLLMICTVGAQDTARKTTMKELLGLSKEQVAKWKEINDKSKADAAAVDADAALDEKAKKTKKKEISTEKNNKFNEILTPEQREKYAAYLQQKKEEKEAAKKAAAGQ
jgi:Spy/CpxP family protein refolding chaperone